MDPIPASLRTAGPGRSLPSRPAPAIAAGRTAGANLLVDQAQILDSMLQAVRGARHVIDVSMYSWLPSGAGLALGEALRARARAGVEVNVTLDASGSLQWPWSAARCYFDGLARDGVRVRRTGSPFDELLLRSVDHRKLLVADARAAFIGGMNLAKGYGSWHDAMVRLEGPAAAAAAASFVGGWARAGGGASPRRDALLARHATSSRSAGVQLLENRPAEGEQAATRAVLARIYGARERVWVQTPFLGDEVIVRALVAAARRGVDVRVLVAGRGTFPLLPALSRTFLPDLLAAGIRVFERPTMTHKKLVLTDGYVTMGSMNVTRRSRARDVELTVGLSDRALVDKVAAMYRADQADTKEHGAAGLGASDRILAARPVASVVRAALGLLA